VSEEIQQLVSSPNGNLLAVLTTHTVHIAILPNPSHLRAPDTGPIKLKAHTLGPTTHVLSQPAVISALWHPLGVSGSCVVTVTADAVVRVWELNPENRWSFDSPNLAVDLKKLVDATSSTDDFSASLMGRNKGFSPDSFEMDVASACFGGEGVEQENGWASMTLWVAMREGDLYALCPLLPSKFQPSMSLVPSLSISSVTNMVACQDDPSVSEETRRSCSLQMDWMKDIDDQEPISTNTLNEYGEDMPVYNRPSKPGPIPKLQGPFQLDSDSGDDGEDEDLVTDIYAIAARSDPNEIFQDDEQEFEDSPQGLSLGLICLLTERGRVRICIDTEGVKGKWLPIKNVGSKDPSCFLY
jgi:nucleoporin NUP82